MPNTLNDFERRAALSHFLKTRRAGIMPEEVGLPGGQRRRTPGLRREELALLADISATWYMWLEQGRDINVSEQVLDRLARALSLNAEERTHLFMLARCHEPVTEASCAYSVSTALQSMLDRLDPCPAYVFSPCFNVLAWNRAAGMVIADFGALPDRNRNILWLLFQDPSVRERFADWPGEARRALARFRANSRRYVGAQGMEDLVRELRRDSPEFRTWWDAHEVLGGMETQTQIAHPRAGSLTFETITLLLAQTPEECVVVYTPVAGTGTDENLTRLLQAASESGR